MKKTKKKKSVFRDKVSSNAKKNKDQDRNYGYLRIPEGITIFKGYSGRVKMDILPYEVTIKNHPDLACFNPLAAFRQAPPPQSIESFPFNTTKS